MKTTIEIQEQVILKLLEKETGRRYLKLNEAVNYYPVSIATLYQWREHETIKFVKLFDKNFIDRDELEKVLTEKRRILK